MLEVARSGALEVARGRHPAEELRGIVPRRAYALQAASGFALESPTSSDGRGQSIASVTSSAPVGFKITSVPFVLLIFSSAVDACGRHPAQCDQDVREVQRFRLGVVNHSLRSHRPRPSEKSHQSFTPVQAAVRTLKSPDAFVRSPSFGPLGFPGHVGRARRFRLNPEPDPREAFPARSCYA